MAISSNYWFLRLFIIYLFLAGNNSYRPRCKISSMQTFFAVSLFSTFLCLFYFHWFSSPLNQSIFWFFLDTWIIFFFFLVTKRCWAAGTETRLSVTYWIVIPLQHLLGNQKIAIKVFSKEMLLNNSCIIL